MTIADKAADEAVAIPPNVVTTTLLRPLIETMWHHSPTFRAQCARVSAAPSLVVDIRFGNATQLGADRARTYVVRSSPNTGRADIYLDLELRSVDEWIELIAHELEHVIEQLDEVQLTPASRHGVHLTASGAFETSRAIHIGQKVSSEVNSQRTAAGGCKPGFQRAVQRRCE